MSATVDQGGSTEALDEPEPPIVRGRISERPIAVRPLPPEGQVRRYVLTSAQNNTYVHEDVWLNVLALASHYDAELLVGTYTYDKGSSIRSVKKGTKRRSDDDDLWYDPHVLDHTCDASVQLAPGLIWCGEMNVLPTATNPLSMLEAYNGRASNIMPHAKFAMESVASLGDEAAKLNYTTGTVTQRNYIQRKAGLKAERYHGYGALLVEVLPDGDWFVRQLEAAPDWSIRDLHLKAEGGVVTDGHPVLAVVWGDVHVRVIDGIARRLAWGEGGMLDELRPSVQLLHDVLDQRARNHHEMKDPIAAFRKWKDRAESVEGEIEEVVAFINDEAWRDWCHTVVVPSNHHEALTRWVKEADWKTDPVNAKFYLRSALALLEGHDDVFKWACEEAGVRDVQFLECDESLVLAKGQDGGLEVGMHGHLGINGARGNSKGFAKLGRKSVIGHMHTAGIHLGVWTVGTTSRMRIGYNRGPSSWSHTHAIIYPEGTASLVTMWDGRWRA